MGDRDAPQQSPRPGQGDLAPARGFEATDRLLSMQLCLIGLLALVALHLGLAAFLPLIPDEAYYWIWSLQLQPGYFDHPPMVAVWMRAGEILLGHGSLGTRLLAPLASALGSILLWRAAEDFFPHRSAGLVAAALFNATLLGGAVSVLLTPDAPLLFFWIATIAALGRWLATGDDRWWIAAGLALGAALLSKYTGLFLIIAVGLWLATASAGRAALRTPWPWTALALALAVFAPNVAWNAAHGWVDFFKQGARLGQSNFSPAFIFLPDLALSQIGLATPLVFALAALGTWRLARAGDARASLLSWLTLTPTALFVEHALFDRVQGQWPAIIYPSACVAAAALPAPLLARWLKPSLALGFALILTVYVQAVVAPFPVPAIVDPTATQFAGWREFTAALARRGAPFVTADGYATLAAIAYYAPPGVVVAGFDSRWTYFDLPSARSLGGATGLMVGERKNPDSPCRDARETLDRTRGATIAWTYGLCTFVAPGDGVLLPQR